MEETEISIRKKHRLEWACRRGMLELDLILMDFLHTTYPQLDLSHQQLFEQLLACTDAELADGLLGGKTQHIASLQTIISRIRQHARRFI